MLLISSTYVPMVMIIMRNSACNNCVQESRYHPSLMHSIVTPISETQYFAEAVYDRNIVALMLCVFYRSRVPHCMQQHRMVTLMW